MNPSRDQFIGCLLGLATGDALGAPHEGGFVERLVWRMIGKTSDGRLRWTDDTQMAIDLASSPLDDGGPQPARIAGRFAASYRWSRGYGPAAAKVLKRIRRGESWESAAKAVYPNGSFGNGAAMRAPVLALYFFNEPVRLIDAARDSAKVTHGHPLGIEGAVMTALATHACLKKSSPKDVLAVAQSACPSPEFSQRLSLATDWLSQNADVPPKEVASKLGNGMTAHTSCPTALYFALRHFDSSFETMMQFIIALRGDVDTIGAMAGAFWGAFNGAHRLPDVNLEAKSAMIDLAVRMQAQMFPAFE